MVARDEVAALSDDERPFVLMPYMHSESLAVHEAAWPLFEAFTNENTQNYEIAHRDVIARFGRYPKRNAALGRKSTADEIAYMDAIGDRAF
jgi:uncharacterized protein (DUF924 family)